jgi:GDP-mannose 6-dehydrogenase
MGVDVSPGKVEMLDAGRSPIVEARIDDLIAEARKSCRLRATIDSAEAVRQSDISFICVGTPGLRSGKLDLSYIERVSQDIGTAIRKKQGSHTVVLRSTLLPGTTESVVIPALQRSSGLRAGKDFSVCYNPEFMREGSAVEDFLQPPCTIFGAAEARELEPLRELYKDIPGPSFETDIPVAEMVKYTSNAFHALKIGFANEIGTMCKNLGVDTETVTKIFTADTKLNISPAYLTPGFAFGGSCLPKDIRALIYRAKELDLRLPLCESILPSNDEHLERAIELILLTAKTRIAMLGLSFKSATDDLRESPHVRLVKRLLGEGRQVRIWDHNVSLGRLVGSNRQYIEEVIPHIGPLLCPSLEQAIETAEVVVVGTRDVSADKLRDLATSDRIIIDLVNLRKSCDSAAHGLYDGICW